MLRSWLFLIAGLTFAVVGWNLGHIFITDLSMVRFIRSEPIMMCCVTFGIATGIIATELFISNPLRIGKVLRLGKNTIWTALIFGGLFGIGAGLLYLAIDSNFIRAITKWPSSTFRMIGWMLIAIGTVIAESFAWANSTYEANDKQRLWLRFWVIFWVVTIGTFIISIVFESLRSSSADFKSVEQQVGFMLLGSTLGLTFSVCTAPSYVASLRAGAGFEYIAGNPGQNGKIKPPLGFIGGFKQDNIEEGLTIQLPNLSMVSLLSSVLKGEADALFSIVNEGVIIGSDSDAHIYVEGVSKKLCKLVPKGNTYSLELLTTSGNKVAINGTLMNVNSEKKLTHNTIITIYHENDSSKFYRFVYYNRFLDPFS